MASLEGLLEFVAVVDHGSFSAAAKQLGVSVSHVSRQIAELERRLQAQLFLRTTRRMQPTEPALRLHRSCQPLLEEVLQAQENVTSSVDTLQGPIHLSLAGKFAEERLVPMLTSFCVQHPAIELTIDVSARNVDLLAEGYHLAVRIGPLQSTSALVATRLVAVPLEVVASPSLIDALGPLSEPAELDPRRCLPLGRHPWIFANGDRRQTVVPTGRFASNVGSAMVHGALAGLGVVQVPAYYVQASLQKGDLVRVLPSWRSIEEFMFYLVFPAGRHMPLRVRALVDHLRAQFTDPSPAPDPLPGLMSA